MGNDEHSVPAKLRALPSRSVNQVAIAANRLVDRALSGAGSHRYRYAMLATLEEFGPSSQANLGRCTGIDRSDVVAAVNALVAAGYADRSPDPSDGRRNIVTITPAGVRHLRELGDVLAEVQDELLRSLSAAEREVLVELLNRIADDRDVLGAARRGAARDGQG
ncbi:MarR family winged helix-turn-helix transcriptional regulator [Nocardia stercoris]|uniref:MarR family transcriptional regulator n=1 Tax=Nocardia stercoris TaxID=2483361 RepID=A0A3M2L2W0_9NOCA|nr:MarR family winged helix-turn-helix transcriptional regulator [Nocardia stercoris]RMI31306.1 MarR family transcriptional regulator [Nocardia stercoris]